MIKEGKNREVFQLFHKVYPKGHINPRLKRHIQGLRGDFTKSIPYEYFRLMGNYGLGQERFFNHPFQKVIEELDDINGVGRT